MNEAGKQEPTATSDSALALTECRASTNRRPGGCSGIFFQLLDWNRRFAKKKIFSRKFLGQARSKPTAVSVGQDEKLSKCKGEDDTIRGVSNVKKRPCSSRGAALILEDQHDMKAAGLVARLMGLETLPDANNKEGNSGFCEGSVGEHLDLVKRDFKSDLRPRKFFKSGQLDRESVVRFGAEALQLKSVLSSSKRHRHSNQPKLGSPRSPTLLSSRNAARTSRLIGAATKLLEPGLQATIRSKNTIGYSSRVNQLPINDVITESSGNGVMVTELVKHKEEQKSACFSAGISRPIIAQASCKNCGNLVNLVEDGTVSCSDTVVSNKGFDIIHSRSFAEQDNSRNVNLQGPAVDDQDNVKFCISGAKERSSDEHKKKWESRDAMESEVNQKTIVIQNGKPIGKVGVSPPEKYSTLQTKRALRSGGSKVNSKSKSKVFGRYYESYIAAEMKTPQYRKKVGFSFPDDNRFYEGSLGRPRKTKMDVSGWKGHRSTDNSCASGTSDRQRGNDVKEMPSYVFGAQLKDQTSDPGSFSKWKNLNAESSPFRSKQAPEERDSFKMGHKSLVSREAALGQFLENKLRELASYRDDKPQFGGVSHKRSVATLLQELITALATEQTLVPPTTTDISNTLLKEKVRVKESSTIISNKNNLLQRVNIREPSLPGGSCLYDHCDDKSDVSPGCGEMLQPCKKGSNHSTYPSEMSVNPKLVTHMLDHITELLKKVNQTCGGLISGQTFYAKEVILNAELIFYNATKPHPISLCSFLQFCLLDELDTLAVAISTYIGSLAFAGSKGRTKLRRFMFDCLIEFLHIKYGPVHTMSWRRVPCQLDTTILMDEVAMEVHRWTISTPVIPELDMNQKSHKWTDFELEVFETGAEIGNDILQLLVHEVISEL